MTRRLASLGALLGYVAGQMAALPHAHPNGNAHGAWQSAMPHVHSSLPSAAAHEHEDGHRHGHHHHGHHHESAHAKIAATDSISSSNDHDADAFYFAASSTHLELRDGSELWWLTAHAAHSFSQIVGTSPSEENGAGFDAPQHPPDGGYFGCALFLKLRTLRI